MKKKILAAFVAGAMAVSTMGLAVYAAPPAGATQVFAPQFSATERGGFSPVGFNLQDTVMGEDTVIAPVEAVQGIGQAVMFEVVAAQGGPRFVFTRFEEFTDIAAPENPTTISGDIVHLTFQASFWNSNEASFAEIAIKDSANNTGDAGFMEAYRAPRFMGNRGDASRDWGTNYHLGFNIFRIFRSGVDNILWYGAGSHFQMPGDLQAGGAHSHAAATDRQFPPAFAAEDTWTTFDVTLNFVERVITVNAVHESGAVYNGAPMPMADEITATSGVTNPIGNEIGSIALAGGRQGGSNAMSRVGFANLAIYTAAAGGAVTPPDATTPTQPPVTPTAPPTPPTGNVTPPPTTNVDTNDGMSFATVGVIGGLLLAAAGAVVVLKKRQAN